MLELVTQLHYSNQAMHGTHSEWYLESAASVLVRCAVAENLTTLFTLKIQRRDWKRKKRKAAVLSNWHQAFVFLCLLHDAVFISGKWFLTRSARRWINTLTSDATLSATVEAAMTGPRQQGNDEEMNWCLILIIWKKLQIKVSTVIPIRLICRLFPL